MGDRWLPSWPVRVGRTQSLVGVNEKRGGLKSSEHVLFLGCCDASDVIDAEECIIGIVRGSGGSLDPQHFAFLWFIRVDGTR